MINGTPHRLLPAPSASLSSAQDSVGSAFFGPGFGSFLCSGGPLVFPIILNESRDPSEELEIIVNRWYWTRGFTIGSDGDHDEVAKRYHLTVRVHKSCWRVVESSRRRERVTKATSAGSCGECSQCFNMPSHHRLREPGGPITVQLYRTSKVGYARPDLC